jgi:hypothetical protein
MCKNVNKCFDIPWVVGSDVSSAGALDFTCSPFDTPATASDGVIYFRTMPTEPALKRAVAFVDGQNLYHSAKTAFGYHYPNYDVHALANAVCARQGWQLQQVRLYTGIPDVADNTFWNHFWTAKFSQMGRQSVYVFWRLRPRKRINFPLDPAALPSVG